MARDDEDHQGIVALAVRVGNLAEAVDALRQQVAELDNDIQDRLTRAVKCNIAAAFIVGCIGLLFWMAVDRKQPYQYLEGNVLPSDPAVGSQVSIHWHVRVHRFCPGWVERNVTDARGYLWHNIGTPVKDIRSVIVGAEAHIVNTFELPRQLGQGPAHYQARVCYTCNPLQRWARWPICVVTPRLPFEIR
jgi:hypothetical protein